MSDIEIARNANKKNINEIAINLNLQENSLAMNIALGSNSNNINFAI